MVPRWLLVSAASLLLVLGGCITPPEQEVDTNLEPEGPKLRTQTRTMAATVAGPQVHLEAETVAGPWELAAPDHIESVEIDANWTVEGNEFQLRVTTPDGSTVSVAEAEGQARYVPEDPQTGMYRIEIVGSGLILEDKVTVGLSWAWMEYPDELAAGPIEVEQVGERFRATIIYETSGNATEPLTLDVYTYNGEIQLDHKEGEPAQGTVRAYAMATSKERAVELVRDVAVSLGIDQDTFKARASNRNTDQKDGESSGASIHLQVPVQVSGDMRTSNGPLRFEKVTAQDLKARSSNGAVVLNEVTADGLEIRTSNGKVSGKLTAGGDVSIRTSNGPFDLSFTPTDALLLDLRTSNGPIDLRLAEGDDVGYRLAADTSNGKVTADMTEASLSGEDDDEQQLETQGYSDRTHQVSGEVRTSNGNIHFKGS